MLSTPKLIPDLTPILAKGDKRCSYLPPADDEIRMLDFRDEVLVGAFLLRNTFVADTFAQATPKDIEELVEVGQSGHICPYFGSRRAIPQAQVGITAFRLFHYIIADSSCSWSSSRIIFFCRRQREKP